MDERDRAFLNAAPFGLEGYGCPSVGMVVPKTPISGVKLAEP
ncbi:hypothetical protein [Microseira wollei]|nr:hypothetical protein [Microseira wollei]